LNPEAEKGMLFVQKAYRISGIIFGVLFCCLLFSGTSYAATYTVQPGDTFYLIALQYGLSADQLMAANGNASTDLTPGQVLTIPDESQSGPSQTPGDHQYTVAAGDTMFQIAESSGTTLDSLVALNHLTPDSQGDIVIHPGQVLQLPGSLVGSAAALNGGAAAASGSYTPGTGEAAWTKQYTIRPGDTLYQLAQQADTSVDAIITKNNLADTSLYPGQQLLLPGQSTRFSEPGAGSSSPQASRGSATSGDTYLLAQLINAEAGGEPFEGQVAVGAVVLNRLFNPDFPKTIKDIIFQYDSDLDTYQFEPVQNGSINEQPGPSAIRAAYAALSGWDPTGGALFFCNPQAVSSFFDSSLAYLKQIGNQLFYK